MARNSADIPLFWQEHVPEGAREMIAKRRRRFVEKASALEEEGFIAVTQVTADSGWLLRRGDPDVKYMIEGRVRRQVQERIEAMFTGSDMLFRFSRGTVVPRVAPQKISQPSDFRASKNGFTVYVKEVVNSNKFTLAQALGLETSQVVEVSG